MVRDSTEEMGRAKMCEVWKARSIIVIVRKPFYFPCFLSIPSRQPLRHCFVDMVTVVENLLDQSMSDGQL